jgi:hypothetical protein
MQRLPLRQPTVPSCLTTPRFLGRLLVVGATLGLAPSPPALATPVEKALPQGEGEVPKIAALGAFVRGPASFVPGTPAALRIATHWSTSPSRSGPLGGVDIEVRMRDNSHEAVLWRGRTGANGAADARFSAPTWPAGRYTLTIQSRSGERHGESSHEVELQPMGKLRLESDKPLYQPSQVIHLRALGLRAQDNRPLAGEKIRFEIHDPKGTRILSVEKSLSRFGIAAADLPLADEISLGNYKARVFPVDPSSGVESAQLTVEVSRYLLPRFKIAIESDRTWYSPGDTVSLTVDARYAFGKPIADGTATVEASLKGKSIAIPVARLGGTTLGPDGRATFSFPLPPPERAAIADDGKLRLRIDISDRADHRETVVRELAVSAAPVRVEVVPERPNLVARLDNRLWVVAALPDEKPAADAEVTITFEGSELFARSNAIGVAEFVVRPAASKSARHGCGFHKIPVGVALKHKGTSHQSKNCVGWEDHPGILLSADRAIYPMGEPMVLTIDAPEAKGVAYVDVVRNGQTTDTLVVELRDGRGRSTLPPDPRRSGTVVLEAYVIAPDGRRSHDARMVYVENPAALRLELAAQPTYRPGETGKLRLRVLDAQTGAGQQAAVGLVMVDQALLALRPARPGATRAYFSLAAEARKPAVAMKARPGGWTVERLVEEGARDLLRQQAARILFAGAEPSWRKLWEIDPWELRERAAREQSSRLGSAARGWVMDHMAGERVPGSPTEWRWREDLVTQMIADGTLPATDARDPWEQPVTTEQVVQAAGLGDFAPHAAAKLDRQVAAIYQGLASHKDALQVDTSVKDRWPAVIVDMADLERWLPGTLVDPWGTPLRLEKWKWLVSINHVRSRYVVASAGPDGVAGTPDDLYACDWFGSVAARPMEEAFSKRKERGYDRYGRLLGDAYGVGGLGLMGSGEGGGGGTGEGTIGLGSFGTIGRAGPAEHVRRSFPETMLWVPELLTDASGTLAIDVEMADSITTWRLAAQAVSEDGRLGFAATDVRVFQSFFIEIDLPTVATQHDELHLPVAVYNYLDTPQKITLTVEEAPWFARIGGSEQTVDVAPSQVGVGYFPIRLLGFGRQTLRVRAVGSAGTRDVLERAIEIAPDGEDRVLSFQRRLTSNAEGASVEHKIEVAPNAIAGTSKVELKLYPDAVAHVVEGLEALLQTPHGCFEQTSSTTYPNALILDYLRRSGRSTPAIERKASDYLVLGYQRLLSFEVPGGGFSLFGQAPADPILTAYGLQEFHDMARVTPVDPQVVERTRQWLARQQQSDGGFATVGHGGSPESARDAIRRTAYVAAALEHVGGDAKVIAAARAFIDRIAAKHPIRDAYTLALVAGLEAGTRAQGADRKRLLDALWTQRTDRPDGSVSFQTAGMTLMHGWGDSTEVTALAAMAFIRAEPSAARSARAIQFLLSSKDPAGAWRSTQATILAIKALLAERHSARNKPSTVRVSVDGAEARKVELAQGASLLEGVALPRAATQGTHTVALQWDGEGELAYQLVARWVEPRNAVARDGGNTGTSADGTLLVGTTLDKAELATGETATATVEVDIRAPRPLEMPIVTVGVPPGCDVDMEVLDGLVGSKGVERVERAQRGIVFYLRQLAPGSTLYLPVRLTPRFPMTVQIPPSRIYEYYQPDYQAASSPSILTVLPKPANHEVRPR